MVDILVAAFATSGCLITLTVPFILETLSSQLVEASAIATSSFSRRPLAQQHNNAAHDL